MKSPETPRSREEHLKSKRPQINEEMALMKIFTVINATEQRNVCTSYTILHGNEKARLRKQH
jgi:hypothetical protein